MSDNYVEYSPKCVSFKPREDDESKVPNFRLLYRNTKSPERDKSSGVSSDDETISSSLVPIPDTLKQMRSELKKTATDLAENSEDASLRTRNGALPKPAEKVMQSLEELRKKYTFLNENSVTWKMNSANLMLDDILNGTNFNGNENCKEMNFKAAAAAAGESESETLNTEVSTCPTNGCVNFPNACTHANGPLNFPPPCRVHHPLFPPPCDCYSSLEKGQLRPPIRIENNHKGKSLGERIQNLKGIRAVYQTFLKTKNPFNKSKDGEMGHQGIPGANHENYPITNERTVCKCEITNSLQGRYPKKMIFDLVESSENSDAKSTEKEEMDCTCRNQRCTCPEVIPKCVCIDYACQAGEHTSECRSKENSQTPDKFRQGDGKNESTPRRKNEDESGLLVQNEYGDGDDDDDPNKNKTNCSRKTHPEWKKYCLKERKYIERTDIYYFDHGNSAYYRTTDNHPLRYTECLVERTDEYATKFWAEIFGFIGIGIAFLISFILQLYRFLFASVLRSLTVGLLQIFSDYFFKPLLTVLFNGIIQPCLILAYNVATSFRDLCLPISEIFGFFAKEIANIFRAFRIVEIGHDRLPCNCGNKA